MAEPAHEDRRLMQRVAAGDHTALAQLYDRFSAAVYGLAYRVAGDDAVAQDITQETFLKVWQGRARWHADRGRLSSWLLTITRYTAIDHLRALKRQPLTSLDDAPEVAAEEVDDALLTDARLLRDLMAQLPPEQALAIELAFFHGLTHRDLADRLGLPLGTVKTRVRLGLLKLRDAWLAATSEGED